MPGRVGSLPRSSRHGHGLRPTQSFYVSAGKSARKYETCLELDPELPDDQSVLERKKNYLNRKLFYASSTISSWSQSSDPPTGDLQRSKPQTVLDGNKQVLPKKFIYD